MKNIFISIIVFILFFISTSCAQPNAKTTYQVGIVNPLSDRTYLYFNEIKSDTLTSRLSYNMDYLQPTVVDLLKPLSNFITVGDTLFGERAIFDSELTRFIKHGLVAKNNNTTKYSGMVVTGWVSMDKLESKPQFFIRKKK